MSAISLRWPNLTLKIPYGVSELAGASFSIHIVCRGLGDGERRGVCGGIEEVFGGLGGPKQWQRIYWCDAVDSGVWDNGVRSVRGPHCF